MQIQTNDNEALKIAEEIPIWAPKHEIVDSLKKHGGFSMIITGSRRSGKSEMLKYLLVNTECNLLKYFNSVVVFSKSLINGFYNEFIPGKLKFKDFNADVLTQLNSVVNEYKQEKKTFRYLVVLDDIIDNKIKYIDAIGDLFYQGRHFNASVIFLTQKLSLIATGWLANTEYFICLFSGARKEKEFVNERMIVDTIYERFPSKKKSEIEHIGYFLISTICKDYNAIICTPYNAETKIWKFKAKLTKKRKPADLN